ncbi:MAG TPA: hypothetical protein VEY93_01530 [Longimicrobium sp.]|nr:hypothetical protein [Longimicrobium sp.]
MRKAFLGFVLLVVHAAACAPHDSPVLPDRTPEEIQLSSTGPSYAGAYVTSFIECTVDVWTGAPATACRSASQPYLGVGVHAALITQQCNVVCVDALPPAYEGGAIVVNVRVRNAGRQAIGTADGLTASGRGTALVLLETPRSVAGLGAIRVADPKHTITAHPALPPNTLYSRFDGIIPPSKFTAWRRWIFGVPQTVRRFSFRVAVITDVEPLVKITEVLPGLRTQGVVRAGAMVELQNVGAAPISNTTLLVLDSLGAGQPTRVAGVPVAVTDEWHPGERRIVGASDLQRILVAPLAGWFPERYVFEYGWQHRLRVVVGSRGGRVLDEVIIPQNTFAASGVAWERSAKAMAEASTKIQYPAWTGVTTVAPTRCAGQTGCPVLKASPAR